MRSIAQCRAAAAQALRTSVVAMLALGTLWSPHAGAASARTAGDGVPACSTGYAPAGRVEGKPLMVRAGRASGVAPLMVFLDARVDGAGVGADAPSSTAFTELDLQWNFGDPVQGKPGRWMEGTAGGTRNESTGPMGAHWYTKPGRYTVSVDADGAGRAPAYRCTIDVLDPQEVFAGRRTACFSASGNFDGCPAGAEQMTSSDWLQVVGSAARGPRRLLLRRGETFRASGPGALTADGPGQIGAFGEPDAARPRIVAGEEFARDAPILRLSGQRVRMQDWRITDLHFDGSQAGGRPIGVTAIGSADQVSIADNTFSALRAAILTSSPVLGAQGRMWDQWGIVGNRITDFVTAIPGDAGTLPYGVYLAGERMFFAGNRVDGAQGSVVRGISHNTRFPYLAWALIDHNTLGNPGPTAHNIKLHAPAWPRGVGEPAGSGGGYSRWIQISDNRIESKSNAWQVVVGPASPDVDERVRDVRIVDNALIFSPTTQVGLVLFGLDDVLVQGNLIDGQAAKEATAIFAGTRGKAGGVSQPVQGLHARRNVVLGGGRSDQRAPNVVAGDGTAKGIREGANAASRGCADRAVDWVGPVMRRTAVEGVESCRP